MNLNQKIYSLLGLAMKAGKLQSGEFSVEKTVKSRRGFLVLVAEDASDNTKKMFTNMCDFYKVPLFVFGTKEMLGHAIGKERRASLVLLDEGFAKSISKQLDMAQNGGSVDVKN